MFISPLTGELGESYAGGRMAMTMFHAGYDAIVITGRAKAPTYLTIYENDVLFRCAHRTAETILRNAFRKWAVERVDGPGDPAGIPRPFGRAGSGSMIAIVHPGSLTSKKFLLTNAARSRIISYIQFWRFPHEQPQPYTEQPF